MIIIIIMMMMMIIFWLRHLAKFPSSPYLLTPFPSRFSLRCLTADLPTNIMDFRRFDSSTILSLRGGIPRPIGDLPESLSQAILVGITLVGRLGLPAHS